MTRISDEHNVSAPTPGRQSIPTVIRPAMFADAEAVGVLLASALEAKYRPTLGRRAAAALTNVIRDELRTPPHGYWVAERGGSIIAAAHLATAEDAPAVGLAQRLSQIIGWTRTIWALSALSILAHGPLEDDEAYIGELAVAAHARRQGVAATLMGQLDVHATALGKTRLTLWVTHDNAPARALYADLGFSERARRTWRVGRLVFGSPGALLMEKRLIASAEVSDA
jgi:ribosomal protein S18 acetylase RimI-like enzyme